MCTKYKRSFCLFAFVYSHRFKGLIWIRQSLKKHCKLICTLYSNGRFQTLLLCFFSSKLLPDQASLLNKTKLYMHHPLRNLQSAYKTVLVRENTKIEKCWIFWTLDKVTYGSYASVLLLSINFVIIFSSCIHSIFDNDEIYYQ